ncbi:hypothetical protein MARI_25390 [Marinobacter sp. JH2]|uniref:hypothetical protein n=1 Tax=Marinobacter sp. AL4B TaxID=2871173 RepID=UPI0010C4ED94|nr:MULTISPECIES: hypothetical protein [unclassified Marinobacter]MBZ0335605.1 hypothetical protein [Marinobacter sp. AL4B]QBM18398.1 hypothetical protein MARI_25390 [Marinobacter sp. JH2]
MSLQKRPTGGEQPSTLGALKLRVPFVHYKLEIPDILQGAILCVVPLSITALMTSVLGIPFEIAVAFVLFNNILYLLHTHFGDPTVAGWITAGIPLYVAFLMGYPEGEARILALIALQLTVALVFLGLGVFKGADSLVRKMPMSLKAGILIGAGVSAVMGEFAADGRVWTMPITILTGAVLGFFMLFSETAGPLRARYGFFRFVAQYGIAIPFLIAYVFGLIIGEVEMPVVEWGFTTIPMGTILQEYSIIGLGLPPFQYFIDAIPLALAAYIIAFGDILVMDSLFKNADSVRKDEKLVFSPRRNSIIVGIRNTLHGIFAPFISLSGPGWTGGQALVINRYMNNPRSVMDSYWGGATSLYWGMTIAIVLVPVVTLFKPGLNIGMALTLLIQGYLCGYLAIEMLERETNLERGVAIIVGSVLAVKGAAWGLGIGLVLWLVLEKNWFADAYKATHHQDDEPAPDTDAVVDRS